MYSRLYVPVIGLGSRTQGGGIDRGGDRVGGSVYLAFLNLVHNPFRLPSLTSLETNYLLLV